MSTFQHDKFYVLTNKPSSSGLAYKVHKEYLKRDKSHILI